MGCGCGEAGWAESEFAATFRTFHHFAIDPGQQTAYKNRHQLNPAGASFPLLCQNDFAVV